MFHLPDSFQVAHHVQPNLSCCWMFHLLISLQVSFFSQVMRSQKPILVLMKEYYNLSQSAQQSYHAAKKKLARSTRSPSKDEKALAKKRLAKTSGSDSTPIWLPMPKCMCDDNPVLKKKSDQKYCGCFVPRLAFIIDYMLSLLGITTKDGETPTSDLRLSDLLICCDTNSLHLLKRLGQALHIVDIDFIIYESDTWTNPHYSHEASSPEDRLDAAGSALGSGSIYLLWNHKTETNIKRFNPTELQDTLTKCWSQPPWEVEVWRRRSLSTSLQRWSVGISWNQLLSKIKKMVADIIFSEHGRLLGNCEREKLHRSCQPKHQPGNNQHHHQVKIVKIASTGDHYHGGRSKGGKPQPCECHRQLGERGEHGLAKPTSGKVIFLWFLDCESNMKSKHPLSTAFVSHHFISGKAWICPAGSQAQNLTVLSGSSND